jgi:hypothetical protein
MKRIAGSEKENLKLKKKTREKEKEHNFVRRFPGYARSSFW